VVIFGDIFQKIRDLLQNISFPNIFFAKWQKTITKKSLMQRSDETKL
jgi:hypothetical protein